MVEIRRAALEMAIRIHSEQTAGGSTKSIIETAEALCGFIFSEPKAENRERRLNENFKCANSGCDKLGNACDCPNDQD